MPYTVPPEYSEYDNKIPDAARKAMSPVERLAHCLWADELWRDGIANSDLVAGRDSMTRSLTVLKNAKPSAETTDRAAELHKVAGSADAALSRLYTAAAAELVRDNPGPPQRLLDRAAAMVTRAVTATPRPAPTAAAGPGNGQVRHLRTSDGRVHDVAGKGYTIENGQLILHKRQGGT